MDKNEHPTVQIDFGRSVFVIQDLIARLEDRGLEDLFLFLFGFATQLLVRCFPAPFPHGQDLSFYGYFLGHVLDEQPPPVVFPLASDGSISAQSCNG